MTRARRWTTGIAATLAAVVAVVAGLALWLVPSDEELAQRIGQTFAQRTGIGLKVGRVHWQLSPLPRIVLENLATAQDEPVVVRRLVLEPRLRALLSRRIRVDELELEGVMVPRESLQAFRGLGATEAASAWTLADVPLGRLRFSDVAWSDRRHIETSYDGEVDFDAQWRPRTADIRRREVTPPARLRLEREGDADRWRTLIDIAGGTGKGTTTLEMLDNGRVRLAALIDDDQIDITQLVAAFKRKAPVAGKLYGKTEVHAEADQLAGLLSGLHTFTRFSVRPATLTRFDLAKAVKTAGVSRGGSTPLDEFTGTLDTRNTGDGVRMTYGGLRARSGLLTATGSASIFNRKLDGEAAVDIVDGVVGMPLKLGGTLDNPELSLTGGALTGAAVGSAVLPGVGTAIGARVGQQMERMFGDKEPAKPAAPQRRRP